MSTVAAMLSLPPGRALLGTITEDRTGLTDRYTLELDYPFTFQAPPCPAPAVIPLLPNGGGQGRTRKLGQRARSARSRRASWSRACSRRLPIS